MERCEIILDGAGFAACAAEWEAFWRAAGGSAFQSHAWIGVWLARDPASGGLRIAVARQDGRILAILPLAVRRYFRGVRVLEWAAQRFCDYGDGLGPPAVLARLWAAVLAHGGFDIVRLRNVAGDAAMHPILADPAQRLAETPDETNLRLRARWPDGRAWMQALNKKKRSNDARGRRILAEQGPVTVERFADAAPAAVVAELVRLKQDWLSRTGGESALLRHGPALLVDFAAALARIGRLQMVVLRCDGALVAGAINAVQGRSVWAFFAAYDARFQRASPGILLMAEYTRWALDQGFREVDYLRGVESYKFEFATSLDRLSCFTRAATPLGWAALLGLRGLEAVQAYRARRAPAADARREELASAYVTAKGTPRAVPEQVIDVAAD